MKKLVLATVSVVALIAASVPSFAASTLAIAGGASVGHVDTAALAASTGPAVSASLQSGANANVGAGFAVSTPVGGLSTGIGTSIGNTAGTSGVLAGPGGAGIAAGAVNNIGVGVGGGFTNNLP